MTEMTCAGVNHSYTALISSSYHFIVTHAATWLNHASRTSINDHIQTISEWEEGITRYRRVL
jgi:hypothetical protein